MKKLLWLVVVFAWLAFVPASFVNAAALSSLSIEMVVEVQEDSSQKVTYTVSGTAAEKQTINFPIVGRVVENVRVDGTPANVTQASLLRGPFTIEYSTVELSATNNWSAVIEYTTNDLVADAPLRTIAIPALEYDSDSVQESITVSAPLANGLPVALGVQADDSEVRDGRQSYFFNDIENRTNSILFDFETTVDYQATWKQELKNHGWWWNDVQMVLSPDTNQQAVEISSISPRPKKMTLDQDGNILLTYSLRPKGSVNVEVKGSIVQRSVRYAIDETRTLSEVGDNLAVYLESTGVWQGGEQVSGETAKEVIEALYTQAVEKAATKSNEDYESFVDDFVADARASGVPARVVSGVLAHNGAQKSLESTRHWWTELYTPGTGWLTVDPAFGLMYDAFASGDAYHVAELIRGVSSSSPQVNESSVTVAPTAVNLEESEQEVPQIEQIRYVVLPGVSVVKTQVSMPAGSVIDSMAYTEDDVVYRLGSLAPLQEVQRWTFAFGANSWGSADVAVGLLTSDGIAPFSESESSVSYWAILYPIAIGVSIIGWIMWRRKSNNKSIKLEEADEDIEVAAEDLLKKSRNINTES